MIDPQTQTNLWGALITLIVAVTAALNEWRAKQQKVNGDEVKQSLVTHNQLVQTGIIEPIKEIKENTNGKLAALRAENDELKARQNAASGTIGKVGTS